MKIIIASDSFKGSLSSKRVCCAIEKGLKKSIPSIESIIVPIADGGEGSLESLNESLNLRYKHIKVVNPLGKNIKAKYLAGKNYAVIEMALASGITLINNKEKNPFLTTSYGTGQLMLDAIKNGYKEIYLCIGGSSTVDGGAGLLQALGIKFFDKNENLINDCMCNYLLADVSHIDTSDFDKITNGVKIFLLSDVKNILFGKNGSVYTYAIQKGAKENDLPILENNLKCLYNLFAKKYKDVSKLKGSGAAGGVGAAINTFFDCQTKSGIDELLKLINFSEKIVNADIIITGEGSIDNQTLKGKVISGIIKNSNNIPVIAIAGNISDFSVINKLGLKSAFCICNKPMSIDESITNAESLIENVSVQIGNLLKLSTKLE